MAKTTGGSAGSGDFYKMGQQMGPDAMDTSTADALTKIGGQVNTMGMAMAAERKAEEKELKKARNDMGDKVSQAFVEMGDTLSQLPQESYAQAQSEVEALRYKMFEAIDAGDSKAQADLMIQLNQIKSRHAGDADNLDTLVKTWEADENEV